MCTLSFCPFLFRISAKGQSSVTAFCRTGASWGEIRKDWIVGQGDLCGVKAFDNLSELEVAHG